MLSALFRLFLVLSVWFLNLYLQLLCNYLKVTSFPFSFEHIHSHLQPTNQPLPLCPIPGCLPHTFLPHCPTDGRRKDPSLLVGSVTSIAHLGAAQGASGCVCASPCARDRGHVSCCTAEALQLQMLLICRLMCFIVLVSEASQPFN